MHISFLRLSSLCAIPMMLARAAFAVLRLVRRRMSPETLWFRSSRFLFRLSPSLSKFVRNLVLYLRYQSAQHTLSASARM